MVHVSSLHGSSIKAPNLTLDAFVLNAAQQEERGCFIRQEGMLDTASEPEEGDA